MLTATMATVTTASAAGVDQGGQDGAAVVAEGALRRCADAAPSGRRPARGRRRRRRSGCARRRPAGRWSGPPPRPPPGPTTRTTLTARAATRRVRAGHDGPPAVAAPEPARPLARADLPGQVGLDQRQVVGVGDARCSGPRRRAPGRARPGPAGRRPAAPADHLGQEHLGVLGRVAGGRPWRPAEHRHMAGPNPHRFIDTRASPSSSLGSTAVLGHEAAVADRADLPALVDRATSAPVPVDLADPPGDRGVADHRVAQAERDERVAGSAVERWPASSARPGSP